MPLLCRQNPRKASVWLPRTELVYWQESLQRTVRGHTRFLRFTGFRAGICNLQSLHWPGSSVVERGPEKAGVGGSIPSLATTILRMPLRLVPGSPGYSEAICPARLAAFTPCNLLVRHPLQTHWRLFSRSWQVFSSLKIDRPRAFCDISVAGRAQIDHHPTI